MVGNNDGVNLLELIVDVTTTDADADVDADVDVDANCCVGY